MGSTLSPVFAIIFVEYVERDLLPSFTGVAASFRIRYVDDALALFSRIFMWRDFCLASIYFSPH